VKYQVIEENGGQLDIFVWDNSGQLRFALTNLEYLSSEDFLGTLEYIEETPEEEAILEIARWESLQVDGSAREAYEALPDDGTGWQLIASNLYGKRGVSKQLGAAGKRAFGIKED